ncbi:Alkaline phosphatase [Drechslerella dactyloides]|uniref:Alkaline phosphatase n=1 Tax=Drechslerella dactyloides TaxID=74499 RepID=A0AAD6J389_DREDA|nr:Alkaline phosphatase [Drechslerella dactyloides]
MPGLLEQLQVIDPDTIPHSLCEKLCVTTTVVIRACAYVFLRWWVPRTTSASFATFVPAFLALLLSKPLFVTTSDDTAITIKTRGGDDGQEHENGNPHNGSVVVEAAKVRVSTRRKISSWRTLGLGVPSLADNPVLTLVSFLVNAVCFIAIYDLAYTLPGYHKAENLSFARTGFVTDQSARILVREPPASVFVKESPVYVVSWKEENTPQQPGRTARTLAQWNTVQVGHFKNTSDYTSSVLLTGLKPMTTYKYLTSGNHSGTFTTAPKRGAKTKFTFLSVPVRPGRDVESYRMAYRQVYSSKDWPLVGQSLPWMHVYDDHEIANDWDQGDGGLYAAAVDPYKAYQHQVNPPPVRENATYYTFNWGPASFFLLDTRRYRSPNNILDGPEKTMLGAGQLSELLDWLRKSDKDIRWKFMVSSVPFTKNWQVNGKDTWRGFQWERSKILEAAWAVKGAGVVVLSGDRHEFAATAFPPPPNSPYPASATVHEFSCSPLSQFYLPFRTYKQTDGQDVRIKYVPDGNSKFGAIDIDSTSPDQAVLKYRLFVDGKEVWDWVLTTPSL